MTRALVVLALLGVPHGGGRTWCVGGQAVTVLDPLLDSTASQELAAHEAAHRRQLAGDCVARLLRAEADPAITLRYEAEAMCAGLAALHLSRSAWQAGLLRDALRLRSAFPSDSDAAIARTLTAACPPPEPS